MSSIKFLDPERTRFTGCLCPFGGFLHLPSDPPDHPGRDLAGEHFSAKTDFALHLFKARPLLYAHGLDSTVEVAPVGTIDKIEVKTKADGVPTPGAWMEAQLDQSSAYFDAVRDLIDRGKAFLSSGAISHLVTTNKRSGEILRWPIAEGSIVVNPANLLAQIVDLTTAARHYKSAGIDLPSSLDVMPAPPQNDDPDIVTGVGALDSLGIRAVWSTAMMNDLPDSAFLYIEPGGKKVDGKTVPRGKRHFPVRDSSGKPDAAHVRNALARIPQSSLPDDVKNRCIAKARRLARSIGIDVGGRSNGKGKSADLRKSLDALLADLGDEDKRTAIRACVDDLIDEMLGDYVDGRAGSYEERIAAVRTDINPIGPYQTGYTNPLATYDDRCIACRTDDDGEESYWDIKLSIDEDGVITHDAGTLIPADEVEDLPVVKAALESAAPLAIFAHAAGLTTEAFAAQVDAVFERRTKEGRVFSQANRRALESEVDTMSVCLDHVKAILGENDKREAMQAKAASLPPIELQAQRLKLLALSDPQAGSASSG